MTQDGWLGPWPRLRRELHYASRVTRCFAERPPTVNAMLAAALRRRPAGEALIASGARLDYRGLEAAVARVAAALAARGVSRGARVALILRNSADFVVSLLAILRLGAIAVALNVRESADGIAYMLENCGAAGLIHHSGLEALAPAPGRAPALAWRWPLAEGATLAPDVLAGLAPAAPPPADVAEEDVAVILYTSGTTGRPKGAMLTHLGIVHAAMIYEAAMALGPADRSVVSVPLSHVTGITAGIGAMLRAAGTLIVIPEFRADAFVAQAVAERMTHTVMVPAMYNLCLLSPAMAAADLSPWRIGGYGGAPMPTTTIDRLAEQLPGLSLFNAYGSTETTGPVVLMPPGQARARNGQVGRAVPNADVLIMDEAGRELPTGESGEIWLKGPNVVPGYWANPDASAASFPDGCWRSGDVGRLDADGFLTLLDRVKDLVNRGGYKVYSVEVENAIATHPDVIEAAVVPRPCPVLGERVHAFVVARNAFADEVALRRQAAGLLADYKVPDSFTFLAEPLPRNAGGKVLKRELRSRLDA